MRKFNESCCVNSRNSQNFLKNRNWPNSAPTLVFRRVLTKENSSLHLMKKDLRKHPAWGWIRVNTKIGPVLDVKVCYHQGRYGVEIMIESLFRNRTVSWVRIVNGINKYVTERSEEIPVASVENRGARIPLAKAKPRPKPTLTLTLVSIPYRERKWIDVDPGKYSQGCFEVSKFMIRLLRHCDTVYRENDEPVIFDDLAEKFKAKFDGTLPWSSEAWITFLAKGGGPKKRFQYCFEPYFFQTLLVFPQSRDIREVLSWIICCKRMHCCRMTSPNTCTTSGTLTTCTPSSREDLFQEEKASRGTGQSVLDANTSSWSFDMEGHAQKFLERNCELANKTTQQLYKVATPCIDDHCWRIVKSLLTDCSEMLEFGPCW